MLEGADPNAIVVFGSVVLIVLIAVTSNIVNSWIKRRSKSVDHDPEFLAALREFKEKTDRRLSNLEALAADEHPISSGKETNTQNSNRKTAIEIELDEKSGRNSGESKRLKNMLNQ